MNITKTVNVTDKREYGYFYEEAMKTLRTNIQLSGKNIKSILFTSTFPNEGKSEISYQIARQFGEAGKKVVYIDADIRKASSNRRMKFPENFKGLTMYLNGMCTMDECVYHTTMPNFDICYAAVVAPNPSELFESEAFEDLIREMEKDYDYIIIDTPPIGFVIDAAVIGKLCDGAVFIVNEDKTSYKAAGKALEQLKMADCKILGAVINKANPKNAGKYYGSKYGHYGYYGASAEKR